MDRFLRPERLDVDIDSPDAGDYWIYRDRAVKAILPDFETLYQ